MKRSLALLAAIAVVATPLAASAAPKPPKKSTRVVSFDYQVARGISGLVILNACAQAPGGCMAFDTVKGEKTITFAITDRSGRPVAISVFVDGEFASANQEICGTGTFKVSPKAATTIGARAVASASCQGLPTSGTIKATITNF